MVLEWKSEADLKSNGIEVNGSARAYQEAEQRLMGFAAIGIQWDAKKLREFLQGHKINTDVYGQGKAKSLEVLTKELQRGETSFMLDTKTNELVRYVEIVWTKIRGPTGKLLIEMKRVYPGHKQRVVERLPGGKRRPLESVPSAARRILAKELTLPDEMLKVDAMAYVGMEHDTDSVIEDIRESPSYPGLKSYYRIHIVEAEIDTANADAELLAEFGLPLEEAFSTHEVTNDRHQWEWVTEERAKSLGALSFDKPASERGPSTFQSLVPALENVWKDTATLSEWMEMYGIDASAGMKLLQNDLTSGNVLLLENSSINALVAVKDFVSVRAVADSNVLIESGDSSLPSILRGAESVKNGAHRLLQMLSSKNVSNLPSTLKLTNELILREESYPDVEGLKVVVRHHIVECLA